MFAKLCILPAQGSPYEFPLDNTASIGRGDGNDIIFSSDNRVSRQHAVIRRKNRSQFQIADLGSRNGVFRNGRQVVLPDLLHDGDVLRIGANQLTFQLVEGTTPDPSESTMGQTLTLENPGRTGFYAAILICDLRGFSEFAAQSTGEITARFLGDWFRRSGSIVENCGGVVDKFLGDAIMAYWIRSSEEAPPETAAFAAAQQILSLADSLRWPGEKADPLKVGIALHSGEVNAGNIGLVAQRDSTIFGETVNTAFRLEAAMKAHRQKLLCSEIFVRASGEPISQALQDLGETTLKGVPKPLRIFGISED